MVSREKGLVLSGFESRPVTAALELRERVLARYQEAYHDYGPTLGAEFLAEDGLEVAVETLRQWLKGAGWWSPQRQRKAHRRRRARKEHWGELLQMDGSHHDWFEGRREWAVLMVTTDDATGRIYARFFEEETLVAAFTTFREYVKKYGLPQAIYVDRAGIYRSDREATEAEILAGKEPQTEFGRAIEEVGVQPGDRVQVREQRDGRVRVFAGERELSWSATRSEPSRPRTATSRRAGPPKSNQGRKPAATHSWRGQKRSGETAAAAGKI